jgi:hypothetical protein
MVQKRTSGLHFILLIENTDCYSTVHCPERTLARRVADGKARPMIHLIKLCVGVRDIAHLAAIQAARPAPLRHQTRNTPKRAAELCDGGSIYWVIGGAVLARQRVTGVVADVWDDGSKCCGLVLDREIVRVAARGIRAFQGWRYLEPKEAPPDLGARGDGGDMPEEMRRALAALALI